MIIPQKAILYTPGGIYYFTFWSTKIGKIYCFISLLYWLWWNRLLYFNFVVHNHSLNLVEVFSFEILELKSPFSSQRIFWTWWLVITDQPNNWSGCKSNLVSEKIEIYLNLIFWFYKQMKTWIALPLYYNIPFGLWFCSTTHICTKARIYIWPKAKSWMTYLMWIGLEAFLHKGTWMWCVGATYNESGQKSKSKHLKGRLGPHVGNVTFLDQRRSVGVPC